MIEPVLGDNARVVLEKRYLRKGALGRTQETPGGLFERVAAAVADAEPARERKLWQSRFFEMMASLRFLPNSPTLMNAGIPKGQLSACFVLPIEDTLEGIFETLKQAALIHQSGGGTGFSFSRLRPKGTLVRATHGVASGPVSFLRIYDQATEIIKQGGARRGANMAVLRVDHPDIFEFTEAKRDQRSITNFNLSLGVTEEFMRAVASGGAIDLRDPFTSAITGRVQAKEIWDRVIQGAWECGDPGLVFLDRIQKFNPTPSVGEMESTNPCGEQPLLPYESCNLGSLNLARYLVGTAFDWKSFRTDIHFAVRFLDNVIEINHFPIAACARITRANRKIGLGVMGLADALLMLGIKYDSAEARAWGERLMSFMDREAKAASAGLARERGAFSNYRDSLWHALGYPPLRNATVTTVAPTGTISLIAGCSSGVEPIFSAAFARNVLAGERLLDAHALASSPAWSPAHEVSLEGHVGMQAVFQRFSDSGVSKTINLPESATPGDISRAYLSAYAAGCKGITVYRDKSRATQVLDLLPEEKAGGVQAVCPSC